MTNLLQLLQAPSSPCCWWGQASEIGSSPWCFSEKDDMFVESNSSFLVAIKGRGQEWAVAILTPFNTILGSEFASYAQDPRALLQLSMNHVLPAPQQACWSPVSWLPPTHKSSFAQAQQLCGKYIPFNNWLSLMWKIESTAEDSFPERDFFFFFNNWN